jgi:hypothetical protein
MGNRMALDHLGAVLAALDSADLRNVRGNQPPRMALSGECRD